MPPKINPDILLAKSYNSGQWKGSYGLVGHTADIVNAVTTIIDTLGDRLIEQFSLNCNLDYLKATTRLAAYIHDWGKANEHFQSVVRFKNKNRRQMLRHEVISTLLALEFKPWLEQCKGNFEIALIATASHHLKLKKEDTEIKQSGTDKIRLYVFEETLQLNRCFGRLLKYGVKALGLPKELPDSLTDKQFMESMTVWTIKTIKSKKSIVTDFCLDTETGDNSFLAVVKLLLIAGDAIGSAIPNLDKSIKHSQKISILQWISNALSKTISENELNRIIATRLQGNSLREFQVNLGQSSTRVTLANAGCGTGKTLGAYNWAKSKAVGGKLIFCYPTTGTSTEGYLDYVHNQCDSELLHSRSDVDLKMAMTITGEEEDVGDDVNSEVAIKLKSFKAWDKKYIVCTVDTVLGLLQCNRQPIYSFPVIAQAAFVFDEVHCYDQRLFGALLRFLKVVKAPILLMSASFLPWQKQEIEKAVGEPIEIISGSEHIEQQSRYRFFCQNNPDWQRVEQELSNQGKVLWVCNQVNTAIAVYQEAKRKGLNALIYHSRYRYKDRVKHHRDVVSAFKPGNNQPVLAITTQVAEMSLDLSATLLISQIANPAGLIQRLGRLNRNYCGHALDAIFYPDDKIDRPYSKNELDKGLRLVQSFSREVSQSDLAQWLEKLNEREEPDCQSILLDKSYQAYPTSLRKGGFNLTALLEEDVSLKDVRNLPLCELLAYTVPIPVNGEKVKSWKKHKFYPVAPANEWDYSDEIGATKTNLGEK